MSENSQSELLESLSALADGETTELELRRILKNEEEAELLQSKWSEYHQIGNLLRREPVKGIDISAAVMAEIESEPRPNTIKRFTRPFGQVAIAASVAVFALFGVQQYQVAQLNSELDNNSVAEIESAIDTAEPFEFAPPVGFEIQPQTSTVSTHPEATNRPSARIEIPFDQRALYEHLNESILEHSKNASEAAQDVYPMLRVPAEN